MFSSGKFYFFVFKSEMAFKCIKKRINNFIYKRFGPVDSLQTDIRNAYIRAMNSKNIEELVQLYGHLPLSYHRLVTRGHHRQLLNNYNRSSWKKSNLLWMNNLLNLLIKNNNNRFQMYTQIWICFDFSLVLETYFYYSNFITVVGNTLEDYTKL